MTDRQMDRVAARATGVGIGLISLMVAWLLGNRVFTLAWGVPAGPTVAILVAIVLGATVAVVAGHRLALVLVREHGADAQRAGPTE